MKPYEQSIDQIEAQDSPIAVVPVGSLEQHSHHLPLSTDIIVAQAFADGIGSALDAFVLPCLPISTCREHMGKKGSVWMDPDTFMRMLSDILLSLREQGFRKAVIVQGHGGIFALPVVVRQINATCNPGFMVCKVEPYQFQSLLIREGILSDVDGLHADEFETSVVMHVRPDLVRLDQAVDFVPDVPREYLGYGSIFRACPEGVWGYPRRASAETGKRALSRGIELATQAIERAFSYMDTKEPFGYSSY